MKVLQIDDSKQICDMYADMFTSESDSIESANDGKTGLLLVIKNDYDLILLDIRMPKYSGIDFLKHLKKQRPSELKKVVVTSMVPFNADQVIRIMDFGIHSIEKKPLSFQKFEEFQEFVSLNKKKTMLHSERILVIDDNKETTKMLSKFFYSKGFQTVTTNNPWEGLRYIQREKFDAILLDINMPEFTGLQIISTLASGQILKNQNIFLFSGDLNCDNQIKDLLRKDGIKDCIKKPMSPNKILKIITKDFKLQKTISSEII